MKCKACGHPDWVHFVSGCLAAVDNDKGEEVECPCEITGDSFNNSKK